MPAIRRTLCLAAALLVVGAWLLAGAGVARADDAPPVATPSPIVGPRTDPAAIPHTNVIALPLIANMTDLPPQLAEAAAVYAGQTQYTPGAGVARTITPYSVGITLLPAGSAPVAQPGTLASPQVDVVVRPVAVARRASTVASMSAAMIAGSPSLMPGAMPTQLVAVALPSPAVPSSVVAQTDAPIVATQSGTGAGMIQTQLPMVTVGSPVAAATTVAPTTVAAPAAAATPTGGSCCGIVVIAPGAAEIGPAAPAAPVAADSYAATAAHAAPPQAPVLIGEGAESVVCNNFNARGTWASVQSETDIWSDWYGGWAPFAVNDGFRQAKNTTFSLERVIGPGSNYGTGYAVKIAGNQPYAGGFGSPILRVEPGATVTVRVKYLVWDYIQNPDDAHRVRDWASMGIKPDAHGSEALYVNGYVRGQWDQLTNSVKAGPSGLVMVLLQGESAASVNSNIYFDDVQVFVDGAAMQSCVYE